MVDPEYVEVLHRSVKPGGRVLVQQMPRPRGRWPGGGPFIEHFLAPDMHMRLVGGLLSFRDGRMGVDQLLCVRPGGAHTLPPVRPW